MQQLLPLLMPSRKAPVIILLNHLRLTSWSTPSGAVYHGPTFVTAKDAQTAKTNVINRLRKIYKESEIKVFDAE